MAPIPSESHTPNSIAAAADLTPSESPHQNVAFLGRTSEGESDRIRIDYSPARERLPIVHPGRDAPVEEIAAGSRLEELVDDYKLALVHQALRQSGGNHRRASTLLGIHRSSFTRMLHRLEDASRARLGTETEGEDQHGD